MQWFEGSIVEAITAAKSANAIFVVYVHDSSEASTQTELVLNDSEVSSLLSSTQFVAIKLENGSDGAKQFSQIYPLVLVPSLFFISGQSGVPLEIVGGAVSNDDLMNKLHKLNPTCGQDKSPSSQSIDNQETQDSEPTERKETADIEKDSSIEDLSTAVVDTSHATTSAEEPATQPFATQDTEPSASSEEIGDLDNIPLEDRVERAKILLEEKQAHKQKEIEEDDRRKEIERRQIGKDVAKQRQLQHEEELRSAAEERRKDKQEDRIARERVKAQIAADRAEREARNAALRGEQPQEKSTAPSDSTTATSTAAAASQCSHSVCRIKFRLPDGSSSVAQFPPESSLRIVWEHVNNNIAVPFRTFEMTSTMRPHPFSQDDMDKALTDLDLVPSAILIITPGSSGRSGAIAASNGSILNFLWLILSPITFILGLVRSLFGGSREQSRDPRHDNEFKSEEPVSKKPREEGSSTTRNRPKTAYGSRGDAYRREGNVHRFANKDDDDDENNTWNGNSTQQISRGQKHSSKWESSTGIPCLTM